MAYHVIRKVPRLKRRAFQEGYVGTRTNAGLTTESQSCENTADARRRTLVEPQEQVKHNPRVSVRQWNKSIQ